MNETDVYNSLLKRTRQKFYNTNNNGDRLVAKIPSFASEILFNIPVQTKKIEKMRYFELLEKHSTEKNKIYFVPALIVRTYKHLVFVHIESSKNLTYPQIFSMRLLFLIF